MRTQLISPWILFLCLFAAAAAPALQPQQARSASPEPRVAIGYERPDGQAMTARLYELTVELKRYDEIDEIRPLVEEAESLYDWLETMDTLLYYTAWDAQEIALMDSLYEALSEAYQLFLFALLEKEAGQAVLEEKPYLLNGWETEPMGSALADLYEREAALVEDYLSYAQTASVFYQGRLLGLEDAWSYQDWEAVLLRWYDRHYPVLIKRFAEIVRLRHEIAIARGYENYSELMFAQARRDYTPAMAKRLIDELRQYVLPVREEAYRNGGPYAPDFDMPLSDFMPEMRRILEALDPSFADALAVMEANGLCYTDPGVSGEYAVTFYMPAYRLPMIALTYYGDATGMMSLAHEFGHFYEYLEMGKESVYTHDVSEIHSHAMELLFANHLPSLDAEAGVLLQHDALLFAMDTMLDLSWYAAVELDIYALSPEEMTWKNIERIAVEASALYGRYDDEYPLGRYEWVTDLSLLSEPLHLFSYTISLVSAFELWELSQEDEAGAVEVYKALAHLGVDGIIEATELASLQSPFAAGRIEALAGLLEETLLRKDWERAAYAGVMVGD